MKVKEILAAQARRAVLGAAAAVIIVVAVAQLSPQPLHFTAGRAASLTGADPGGCRGVTRARFAAQGFITTADRDEGGHLWWRTFPGNQTCIGTVIEDVQYNTAATKSWQVIVYDAQSPAGRTAAELNVTSGPGWPQRALHLHQLYTGLTRVCIVATDSFGEPCIVFGPAGAQPVTAADPAASPPPSAAPTHW